MTKREIDNWVTDNFDRMMLLAAARVCKYQRNVEPSVYVNYCYEYLLDRQNELTEDNIESWAFRCINQQVIWTNSETHREELQTQSPFYKSLQFDPRMIQAEADHITEKVKEEEVYQERKAIIALYLRSANHDKVKKRLLQTMLKENILTSRAVAEHFGISNTGAWILIKELKGEVQAFKKQINKYDSQNNF